MDTKKVKVLLSKILPCSQILQFLVFLPKLQEWNKRHREVYPTFDNRYNLFDYINKNVLKNAAIDYLEFGVYKGSSIKYWLTINNSQQSRFWGFDTFTGLPEPWVMFTRRADEGTFDNKGFAPEIDDSRVTFVKGLFQETLPVFLRDYTNKLPLVIHIDSDLYSSCLYVLTQCDPILIPGSVVIFDEFNSILNEFRALEDYCSSYRRTYEVISATNYYEQIAIQII